MTLRFGALLPAAAATLVDPIKDLTARMSDARVAVTAVRIRTGEHGEAAR